MEVSIRAKERFCKDCNIPIRIFQEPYFTDRLTLYNKFYGTLCFVKWGDNLELYLGGNTNYFKFNWIASPQIMQFFQTIVTCKQ